MSPADNTFVFLDEDDDKDSYYVLVAECPHCHRTISYFENNPDHLQNLNIPELEHCPFCNYKVRDALTYKKEKFTPPETWVPSALSERDVYEKIILSLCRYQFAPINLSTLVSVFQVTPVILPIYRFATSANFHYSASCVVPFKSPNGKNTEHRTEYFSGHGNHNEDLYAPAINPAYKLPTMLIDFAKHCTSYGETVSFTENLLPQIHGYSPLYIIDNKNLDATRKNIQTDLEKRMSKIILSEARSRAPAGAQQIHVQSSNYSIYIATPLPMMASFFYANYRINNEVAEFVIEGTGASLKLQPIKWGLLSKCIWGYRLLIPLAALTLISLKFINLWQASGKTVDFSMLKPLLNFIVLPMLFMVLAVVILDFWVAALLRRIRIFLAYKAGVLNKQYNLVRDIILLLAPFVILITLDIVEPEAITVISDWLENFNL